MKIELLTRIQYDDLYERMTSSASQKASEPISFLSKKDTEHQPRLAETYNALARESNADVVGCVHDDVEFLTQGWDRHVKDIFAEYKPDILGVVGTTNYRGGLIFRTGNNFGIGQVANSDGVRIFSIRNRYFPVQVVDGMLMFINRKWLLENPFDERLDGLFYYDADLCLRSSRVGVTDLLVRHSKPKDRYGIYPQGMKPIEDYDGYFNEKHSITPTSVHGDQRCCFVSLEDYLRIGQNTAYREFERKYKCALV